MECIFCGNGDNKIMHVGESKNTVFNRDIVTVCDMCYSNHMNTLEKYILF